MTRHRSLSPVRRSRPLRHTGGRLDEPIRLYLRNSPACLASSSACSSIKTTSSTSLSSSPSSPSSPSSFANNTASNASSTAGDNNWSDSVLVDAGNSSTTSSESSTKRQLTHIRSQPNLLSKKSQRHLAARWLDQHPRLFSHLEEELDQHEHQQDNQRQHVREANGHASNGGQELHEFLIQVVDQQVLQRSEHNLNRLVEIAQTPILASNPQQHVSIALARKALRYRGSQLRHHRGQITHLAGC